MQTQSDGNMIANQSRIASKSKSKTFERYMKLANIAYAEGDARQAYDYWRRAAIKDPYNEDVWLAMLQVLESKEDRQVCLENILVINPMNETARDLLNLQMGTSPTPDKIPTESLRSKVPRFRKQSNGYTKLEIPNGGNPRIMMMVLVIAVIIIATFFVFLTMQGIRTSICFYCV